MDKDCPKRTFRGTVYLKNSGTIRHGNNYAEEFSVEALSREDGQEKIRQAALVFLMKHNLLEIQGFTETTP